MDLKVYDVNKNFIAIVDLYVSVIWAERYNDAGDFELYIPLDSKNLDYLAIGNYLRLQDSDRAMIIDSIQVESEIDTGKRQAVFKGQTLESILKRRIIWGKFYMNAKVETVIERLLVENIISPANQDRQVPGMIYGGAADSNTETYLSTLPDVECQFTGENLFDTVKSLCDQFNLGFKIIFDSSGNFVFQLYYGVSRPVVFSAEYDTLINSRYLKDMSIYKNAALVLGEEEQDGSREAVTAYLEEHEPRGLDRRELYVDCSSVRQEDDGATLSDSEYRNVLQYKGLIELRNNYVTTVFDGEVETHIGPQYGKDYFLGDFVSAINEFGLGSVTQITEYIRSYDPSGYSAYPTFVMMN